MEFRFYGDIEDLQKGIEILGRDLGYSESTSGVPIKVEKVSGNIEVLFQNNEGIIRYNDRIHFFRALGLFVEALNNGNSFSIIEEPQFDKNGAMFDVSRNAVLKTDSIKLLLRKMALMGLNLFMLYTEDTYEIEGRPYFGYMRGRYTREELKECDDYADIFGIEMIPCIQTLAHLAHVLKWKDGWDVVDVNDILLVGSEKTYKLVEDMIRAASAPFRSKRIHIGMDEAHMLGLGRYLKINGYRRSFDIINEHLERVVEITEKYGLKPMIWGDMFFRLGSETGDYYDVNAVIPEDVVKGKPENLQLVYWDYYHQDREIYRQLIKLHSRFGSDTFFAGGIWAWTGFCANYGKTFATTNSALHVCKEEGVREVFATIWGDDGAETNIFCALLGLQLYAEQGYANELDMNKLEKRFKFCTGAEMNAFMDLKYMDETPGNSKDNLDTGNPSKYILWQDILMGQFDKHIEGLEMNSHYARLAEKMKGYKLNDSLWDFIFEVPEKLCSVLSLKSEIGINIKSCYDQKDKKGLKKIAEEHIPELSKRVHELRKAHMKQWFRTNKPFGWEVMDVRYGGLLTRLDTALCRLQDYLEGKVEVIEELEQTRLYFDGRDQAGEVRASGCNSYRRIAAVSDI